MSFGERKSVLPGWARDLMLGARLAFAGGREGWLRTVLTAVGVGLGVVLLLGCAAIPTMSQTRADRETARGDAGGEYSSSAGAGSLLVGDFDTEFRDKSIYGVLVQPVGPDAPVPPGLSALPGPGQLAVSPALARLLDSPGGALLRPRLNYPVIATIGNAGLTGPGEYAFYLGSDRLRGEGLGSVRRITQFGAIAQPAPLSPILLLLVIIIFVVLLLPIAVFIAAAVRFGGEQRDRRLAALRLVGADGGMARRAAAGEALLSSILGVAIGIAVFLIARQLIASITLLGVSVYASDVRPSLALGLLIVVAVPVASVGVTLLALRRVIIEPLGVLRQAAGVRRRLWWRLLLPVLGLALLYPLFRGVNARAGAFHANQAAAGATLLLLGVAAVLPWLIEAVVGRLGGAGRLPWQLAIRRLQLSSGTSARAISGVAVAAAGAIALQMLFGAAQAANTRPTGQDPQRIQAQVTLAGTDSAQAGTLLRRLLAVPGVHSGFALLDFTLVAAGRGAAHTEGTTAGQWGLTVADCAAMREVANVDSCRDGDVFRVTAGADPVDPDLPPPGQRVTIGSPADSDHPDPPQWTVPTSARTVPTIVDASGLSYVGIIATPGAIDAGSLRRPVIEVELRGDLSAPDTVEGIRNASASVDPLALVNPLRATTVTNRFTVIRRGLFLGAIAVLLLIGASLLVGTLEQLRERRRLLAALVALGTRRRTLSWSVFWQTAVPISLGMVLAVAAGLGLGSVLLLIVAEPIRLDWSSIGEITATAGGVVLLVTALSLPALWRLTRPDGLRAE